MLSKKQMNQVAYKYATNSVFIPMVKLGITTLDRQILIE